MSGGEQRSRSDQTLGKNPLNRNTHTMELEASAGDKCPKAFKRNGDKLEPLQSNPSQWNRTFWSLITDDDREKEFYS